MKNRIKLTFWSLWNQNWYLIARICLKKWRMSGAPLATTRFVRVKWLWSYLLVARAPDLAQIDRRANITLACIPKNLYSRSSQRGL
jgi:hypothetical protein